jgi:hypothetical protein
MLSPAKKRYTITPWKVAITGSIVSISFAIPFAILTGVHTIVLPGGIAVPTLYLVSFIPLVSMIWACVGIYRRNRDGNVVWCFFSIFLSFTSMAFAIISSISN